MIYSGLSQKELAYLEELLQNEGAKYDVYFDEEKVEKNREAAHHEAASLYSSITCVNIIALEIDDSELLIMSDLGQKKFRDFFDKRKVIV